MKLYFLTWRMQNIIHLSSIKMTLRYQNYATWWAIIILIISNFWYIHRKKGTIFLWCHSKKIMLLLLSYWWWMDEKLIYWWCFLLCFSKNEHDNSNPLRKPKLILKSLIFFCRTDFTIRKSQSMLLHLEQNRAISPYLTSLLYFNTRKGDKVGEFPKMCFVH